MLDPASHQRAPQLSQSLRLMQLSSPGLSLWQSCWMPGCLQAWMRALKPGTLCCCCKSSALWTGEPAYRNASCLYLRLGVCFVTLLQNLPAS